MSVIDNHPDLLPCPVCGLRAELHQTYESELDPFGGVPDGYVVFCQDSHCAGNNCPEMDTADDACAVWNSPSRRFGTWSKACCPNCGWSDVDEQEFLEHQRNLSWPLRLHEIFQSVSLSGLFACSDLYFLGFFLLLFRHYHVIISSYIPQSSLTFFWQVQFLFIIYSPLVAARFFWGLFESWRQRIAFEKSFDHQQTAQQAQTTN